MFLFKCCMLFFAGYLIEFLKVFFDIKDKKKIFKWLEIFLEVLRLFLD